MKKFLFYLFTFQTMLSVQIAFTSPDIKETKLVPSVIPLMTDWQNNIHWLLPNWRNGDFGELSV